MTTKKKFSYEKAVDEIENIIEEIEKEELNVDDLSAKIKKVAKLLRDCKSKLQETKDDVNNLLTDMEIDR
jgi:exodeoxyribonuclease VII small subunit